MLPALSGTGAPEAVGAPVCAACWRGGAGFCSGGHGILRARLLLAERRWSGLRPAAQSRPEILDVQQPGRQIGGQDRARRGGLDRHRAVDIAVAERALEVGELQQGAVALEVALDTV